jgi:diguanylate cyclase (GGDEF)-like protein
MTLKSKIIFILISVFLLYASIEYFIQRLIIFPNFLELEKFSAQQNLQRSIAAINREIFHLDSKCEDWTAWDDTYEFVKSHSKNYITSNLIKETFITNGFNAIFICDTDGHTIWGKILDLETGKEIGHQDLFQGSSGEQYPLIHPNTVKKPLSKTNISGILMTGKGPMLISSRPIMTSENKGPSRGYAIFGQFLSVSLKRNLVEQTQVNFTISTDKTLIQSFIHNATKHLDAKYNYLINREDEHKLHIYTVYNDIQKNPAFLIKTTIPRDIVKNGLSTTRFALLSVFFIGTGVMLIIILVMKKTIISPITRLTDHVHSLSETRNYSMRLKIKRSDEIGTLARGFDRMVEKIEQQTEELASINDDLKKDIAMRMEVEHALQEANRNLDILAKIDGLTQMANRRQFDENLTIEWKRMKREKLPLSLIICDVDCFKLYNDTYGHIAGDNCLRAIAQVIKDSMKRPSDFTARYGGEEFAIILSNTDSDGAAKIAEIIRASIQALGIPHRTSLAADSVTLSLGIASLIPDETLTVEDLLTLADSALYEAKSQGRNCVALRMPMESVRHLPK